MLTCFEETDEELDERKRNSDKYMREAEQKIKQERLRERDTQDGLEMARKKLSLLHVQRGNFEAEKKVWLTPFSEMKLCYNSKYSIMSKISRIVMRKLNELLINSMSADLRAYLWTGSKL